MRRRKGSVPRTPGWDRIRGWWRRGDGTRPTRRRWGWRRSSERWGGKETPSKSLLTRRGENTQVSPNNDLLRWTSTKIFNFFQPRCQYGSNKFLTSTKVGRWSTSIREVTGNVRNWATGTDVRIFSKLSYLSYRQFIIIFLVKLLLENLSVIYYRQFSYLFLLIFWTNQEYSYLYFERYWCIV